MTLTNLPRSLAQLEAAQLVRQVNAPAWSEELEYMFRHALVQEAAYQSLLKHARVDLHRRVAEAIEQFDADAHDIGSDAAILAMHYARAGIHDKSFLYAAQAGDAARKVYASQEALVHYAQALDAANYLPRGDARWSAAIRDVYANRGGIFEMRGEGASAIENYRAMIAFAEQTDNCVMRADATNHLNTVSIGYQGPKSIEPSDLDYALGLARQANDPLLVGRALWNYGLYYRFLDPVKAAEYLKQALDAARASGSIDHSRPVRELEANALLDLRIAMVIAGRFRNALRYGLESAEAYRALDNKHMLADALGGSSLIHYYQGQPEAARKLASEGARISRAIDNPWGVLFNEWPLYSIQIDRGEYNRTIQDLKARKAMAQAIGFPLFIGVVTMQPARAYLDADQLDLAEPLYDESAVAFDSMQSPIWSLWAKALWALPRIRKGEVSRAREYLEPIWREGDDPVANFQGFVCAGPVIAEWALAEGRIDYGLAFCNWLLAKLESEDAHRVAGEVRYWRARLHMAQGNVAQAKADLQQAHKWLAQADAQVLLRHVDEAMTHTSAIGNR